MSKQVNKEPILLIVQARMGSTRFPGKVLADLHGQPVLGHVLNRLKMVKSISRLVVATSMKPLDDAISKFCELNSVECFRGSEQDVLDRFYRVATHYGATTAVRVTADCPFIDPQLLQSVVQTYLDGDYDYVSNTLRDTYPDGLDVEVFSVTALEAAWREAQLPTEREHVTPYIRKSHRFRKFSVESQVDNRFSRNLRLTVDEPEDLEFLHEIYESLDKKDRVFSLADVIEVVRNRSELMNMNKNFIRNEGYYKSLVLDAPLPPRERKLARSFELRKRAEQLIPSCTQTFSKGPTQYVQGVAPVFLLRGQGSHVVDVDGNDYIDYPMALGAVILGHNYGCVTEAVISQAHGGALFSLPHPLEVDVAALLTETIPCAEMIRFGKNGSDVTSGAVRVARAYTGREIIACCGYHGWQDWYIGTTTRNDGVPKAVQKLTVPFQYNDVESLERIFAQHRSQVAAVIMEPVGVVEPFGDFLEKVRKITLREGALLIFDELITGFRLALGGAQEYFGVVPDLACFGKAVANGYPLSVVAGRREVMKLFDKVFFSFNAGGEVLSLAAAAATIREIREKKVIPYIWEKGGKLKDAYNVLAREFGMGSYTECVGLPPRTIVTFRDENGRECLVLKSLFQQECLKRGVLFSGGHNICFTHSDDDIEHTLRVYRTAMEILANSVSKGDVLRWLEGEPVQPVFRQP